MAFLLYKVSKRKDGSTWYEKQRQVVLAGNHSGTICRYVRDVHKAQLGTDCTWHLDERTLLALWDEDPESHRLVIDLKPRSEEEVSLYEVKDIWGYSEPTWTPIALRLDELFRDKADKNPAAFKEGFSAAGCTRNRVREFLYLQGGTDFKGTWNWGPVGRTNGALLFDRAYEYFQKVLR